MRTGEQKMPGDHGLGQTNLAFIEGDSISVYDTNNHEVIITDIGADQDDIIALILKVSTAIKSGSKIILVLGANGKVAAEASLRILNEQLKLATTNQDCVKVVKYNDYAHYLTKKGQAGDTVSFNSVMWISPETANLYNDDARQQRELGWPAYEVSCDKGTRYYFQGTYVNLKHPTDKDNESKGNGFNINGGVLKVIKRISSNQDCWQNYTEFCDSKTASTLKLNSEAFQAILQIQPKLAEDMIWNSLMQLVSRVSPEMPFAAGLICKNAGGRQTNFNNLNALLESVMGVNIDVMYQQQSRLYMNNEDSIFTDAKFQHIQDMTNAYCEQLTLLPNVSNVKEVKEEVRQRLFIMNWGLEQLFPTIWNGRTAVIVDRKVNEIKKDESFREPHSILLAVAETDASFIPPLYDLFAVARFSDRNCTPEDVIADFLQALREQNNLTAHAENFDGEVKVTRDEVETRDNPAPQATDNNPSWLDLLGQWGPEIVIGIWIALAAWAISSEEVNFSDLKAPPREPYAP